MVRNFVLAAMAWTAGSITALAETITFEQSGNIGAVPAGFSQSTTGKGAEADWKLLKIADAPSGDTVVQQVSVGGDMRFPVLAYDKTLAANVDLSVKFKAITGTTDQAAGLVWRMRDANNYYIVRANALENNVVTYVVKDGRRVDLPVKGKGRTYGVPAPVAKGTWNTLAVSARGNIFKIFLNSQELYEVDDNTFDKAGKAGLWTKADSVMQFDDLTITVAK